MTDLVIRALAESDARLFHALPGPALVGRGRFGHTYATVGQGGEYRPEWTWVALREERVVARAAWWGGPDDTAPVALDWFDFADGEAGAAAELLRTAPLRAEYSLLAPPGWRDRPEERAAARARVDAAVAGGLNPLVERYRYDWTPALGLPGRPGRLEFRPEPDDAVIADVLRHVHQGTLDAHDRRTIAESGVEAALDENLRLLPLVPLPARLVAAGLHAGRRGRRHPGARAQSGRAVRRLHRGRRRSSAATATRTTCSWSAPTTWSNGARRGSPPRPTRPTPRWPRTSPRRAIPSPRSASTSSDASSRPVPSCCASRALRVPQHGPGPAT